MLNPSQALGSVHWCWTPGESPGGPSRRAQVWVLPTSQFNFPGGPGDPRSPEPMGGNRVEDEEMKTQM